MISEMIERCEMIREVSERWQMMDRNDRDDREVKERQTVDRWYRGLCERNNEKVAY